MARRSSRRRDALAIASPAAGGSLERLLGFTPSAARLGWTPIPLSDIDDGLVLSEVDDGRTWHPDPFSRPDRTLSGGRARLQAPPIRGRTGSRSSPAVFSPVVAFQGPSRVLVCVRRARRKEVLHAKGFYGKRRLRKPTRSVLSNISCRRY